MFDASFSDVSAIPSANIFRCIYVSLLGYASSLDFVIQLVSLHADPEAGLGLDYYNGCFIGVVLLLSPPLQSYNFLK